MRYRYLKLFFVLIVIGVAGSCSKEKELSTFSINEDSLEAFIANENCRKVLKESYGIVLDSLPFENEVYARSLLGTFVRQYSGVHATSYAFTKIQRQGEYISTSKFYYNTDASGATEVISRSNLYYDIEPHSEIWSDFDTKDLDTLFKSIIENKSGTYTDILSVRFTSANSCECANYRNVDLLMLKDMEQGRFIKDSF